MIKPDLPEEINELRQRLLCLLAVVVILKMIAVKKFYVLHTANYSLFLNGRPLKYERLV